MTSRRPRGIDTGTVLPSAHPAVSFLVDPENKPNRTCTQCFWHKAKPVLLALVLVRVLVLTVSVRNQNNDHDNIPTATGSFDQQRVVNGILARQDFQTVDTKFCRRRRDGKTETADPSLLSFRWISQGDGTLPLEHVTKGIEKTIGDTIATLLAAELDHTKLMVDVGMNSGYFGVMAAALGFPVRAFDPQSACHALMEQTKAANGFTQHTLENVLTGLGDGGGDGVATSIRMHVHSCHDGYSWPDQWPQGDQPEDVVVEVPVRSLADVVGDRHVALMKMDTEGNEVFILQSGLALFERGQIDYLIVETKPTVWVERAANTHAIQQLEALAHSIVQLETNQTVEQVVGAREGNYLFFFVPNKPPVDQMEQFEFLKC